MHTERLLIYKSLQDFQQAVYSIGHAFPASVVFTSIGTAHLGEIHFPQAQHQALMKIVDLAVRIISPHNECRGQHDSDAPGATATSLDRWILCRFSPTGV